MAWAVECNKMGLGLDNTIDIGFKMASKNRQNSNTNRKHCEGWCNGRHTVISVDNTDQKMDGDQCNLYQYVKKGHCELVI